MFDIEEIQHCVQLWARTGYLQQNEALLKELDTHAASDPVPPDPYEVHGKRCSF